MLTAAHAVGQPASLRTSSAPTESDDDRLLSPLTTTGVFSWQVSKAAPVCEFPDCGKTADSPSSGCAEHKCGFVGCTNLRLLTSKGCAKHTCNHKACGNLTNPGYTMFGLPFKCCPDHRYRSKTGDKPVKRPPPVTPDHKDDRSEDEKQVFVRKIGKKKYSSTNPLALLYLFVSATPPPRFILSRPPVCRTPPRFRTAIRMGRTSASTSGPIPRTKGGKRYWRS